MGSITETPCRIASVSGSVTDRRHGFARIAREEPVDFIVGDYMSEYNMTSRGGSKATDPLIDSYEPCFLESIEPALPYLAERGIKVAVNAGASDTAALHKALLEMIESKGLTLKVAWVEGDEVTEAVTKLAQNGESFQSLTTGKMLSEWGFEPLYAQCYLGCFGIVQCFNMGADIVLCGRVADASPIMACAAYHYGWIRQDLSQLAHAFVAGHFIECSTYVTGGNFSGFKEILDSCTDLGFPIIEMERSGEFVVTKQAHGDGFVTVNTCKAQLLYEIQGPRYYHSDVVAVLDEIIISQVGPNRVRVTNVGHKRPPPTTKVGITARGGYQAEVHYFLCGLDIAEKAKMLETQIRHLLDTSKYHQLVFRTSGSSAPNPSSQDAATVDFRIFAQAKDESALSTSNFFRPCTDTIMQSYPGATFAVDARQAQPRPYYEYWVALLPQTEAKHIAQIPFKGKSIPIPVPVDTEDFLYQQPSYETESPAVLSSFGPTITAPLGYIVHARSGDKGSDANVGFFVRHADEWDWLRSVLTIDKVKQLLGDDYVGNNIFRFELPNICAVHFLLKDHLDRGVSSSSTYDVLGKNVAEYLRAKFVEVPEKFLARGRI